MPVKLTKKIGQRVKDRKSVILHMYFNSRFRRDQTMDFETANNFRFILGTLLGYVYTSQPVFAVVELSMRAPLYNNRLEKKAVALHRKSSCV